MNEVVNSDLCNMQELESISKSFWQEMFEVFIRKILTDPESGGIFL